MANQQASPYRLSDYVSASLSRPHGKDPVHKQQMPMFGLHFTGFGKGVRRLERQANPVRSGFRTSLFPKSPLTPEIENKLKAISLYQALLRSSKGDLKLFKRSQNRSSSRYRKSSYCTETLKHLTQRSLSQASPEPETVSVLYAEEQRPEEGRRTVQILPVICTSISPKSRLIAAASRESHLSIPTPLAPIYSRSTVQPKPTYTSHPSTGISAQLRRLRQSI